MPGGRAAPPTISVVVPTHGRRGRLKRLLEPLLADASALEVIVVVDGDSDGSFELLADTARAEPRLKPHQTPGVGATRARAVGAGLATGDVVLLLDDDVVPSSGLVGGHAGRHAREADNTLVVGYMPVPARLLDNAPARIYAKEYEQTCRFWEHEPEAILTGLWAGNMSLRRDRYLAVAADADRFIDGFHADRDFGLRCAGAGMVAVFDRTLAAQHEFVRPLESFLADAFSGGQSRWQIHRVHSDAVGPLAGDFWLLRLPPPLRVALRAARRPRLRRPALAVVLTLARLAAKLHADRLEELVVRFGRRIEAEHGASQAARDALA
jgi:glycosyltransferase involved in cell wall biosynthesis